MNWTILNSIDLAKIYPRTNTKIVVIDNFFKKNEVTLFFNSFNIPFYINIYGNTFNDKVYFGCQIDFQNLYILAGILKSFGISELYYNPSLNEKITLGSIKRKTISPNQISVPIDGILNLAFDTSFYEFSRDFNLIESQKIDLNKYYIDNGWEIPKEITELNRDSQVNEELDGWSTIDDEYSELNELEIENDSERDNDIDPYEDFHWGGLSGEEAYIGYWNTD